MQITEMTVNEIEKALGRKNLDYHFEKAPKTAQIVKMYVYCCQQIARA